MKRHKRFFSFGFLGLALVLLLSGAMISLPAVSAEEARLETGAFTVTTTARGKEGAATRIGRAGYSLGTYEEYLYDQIEKLTLTVNDLTLTDISSEDPNNTPSINYTISVIYAKKYKDDKPLLDDDHEKEVTLYAGPASEMVRGKQFVFYLDPASANVSEDVAKLHGIGWGIYKFNVAFTPEGGSVPTDTWTSDYFIISPAVMPNESQPEVKKTNVSSRWSVMQNAFYFELVPKPNNVNYKYCDQSLIKWYMYGEAVDGSKYVLTESDRVDQYSTYKGMFTDIDTTREGYTFKFDTDISGTWYVYCIITSRDGETQIARSEAIRVSTGTKINTNTLIWILVAAGVVLLGLIVFIIIYTKKREKVW